MSDDVIAGKSTILIVGASSMIGVAIVRQFLENGDVVVATHCNTKPNLLNGNVKWAQVDLTAEKSIEMFAKGLAKSGVRIDAAIFVSGILPGKSLENYSNSEMDSVMEVNFLGQARCIKALLPLLNSPSQIVMISSISGERGSYDPIYAASKGAVIAFVKSLATTLPPQVRCMAIAPGLVEGSGMYNTMAAELRLVHLNRSPLRELITADDLAKIIVNLTMKHWAHANGTCIRVNGGAYV
jgi:3-oxoacyl-[acyl-carrier protein] reductase